MLKTFIHVLQLKLFLAFLGFTLIFDHLFFSFTLTPVYSFQQEILDMFNAGRNAEIQALTNQIEELKKVEYMLTARKDVIEINRVRLASFIDAL